MVSSHISPTEVRERHGVTATMSFAQQRMWFLDQLVTRPAVYHVPVTCELRGSLDHAVLARCLGALARRHQPLRTGVWQVDGEPQQFIMEPDQLAVPLQWHDLRNLEPADRDHRARQLEGAAARAPFDLGEPPLWRATVVTLSDGHHVLLLTLHHLIVDGWSVLTLMRELTHLYDADVRGEPAALPTLPIAFAEVAGRQRGALTDERVAVELRYWREHLRGAPPLIDLPVDHVRPAEPSYRGGTVEFTVPDELSRQVQALARTLRTTTFVVQLAAVASLLHRYTGQGDIVIGTPVAGRSDADLEHVVGYLANTLVLRVGGCGRTPFVEIVKRVKEAVLTALDHQDVPFERLVADLAPDRTATHHPLFQVMFSATAAAAGWQAADVTFEMVPPVRTGTAKLDLSVGWHEFPAGTNVAIEYATDLFERATVQRMAEHLVTLVRSVVADPRRQIGAHELLTQAEHAAVLDTAPGPEAPAWHPARAVHHQVLAQARRRPDALALDGGGRRMTYGEMVQAADGLAQRLRRLGAGPGTTVAVCHHRSVEMVVVELGTLLAGAAFLPLDPTAPTLRLGRLLERAQPVAVMTDHEQLDRFADIAVPVLAADQLPEVTGADRGAPLAPDVDPDHLAYVIYTSGSTGEPKGVMISHRSLANLTDWCREALTLTQEDRCTALSLPSFDASILEVWPALAAGAGLFLAQERTVSSPPGVRDWMLAEGITAAFLVTPLGEAVMELPWPTTGSPRIVHVGGDRLRRRPDPTLPFTVRNDYGPTECAVASSSATVAVGVGIPPIGRPLPGIEAYVLDERMRPVPDRVAGELYLGGVGLARGYLGRPDLTAELFLPHPWRPGHRLYRTGDRVQWRRDGQLHYLGRTDQQVKIRGYRIEPAEIEAAVTGHPAVFEAAVSVHDGRLVAYAGADPTLDGSRLRAYLAERLPGYLVPASYHLMTELPRTPNGKLDRAALPAPEPAVRADYEAPHTPREAQLARLWCEVLGVDRVGRHHGFFELGGDSLDLGRVHARLGEIIEPPPSLISLYTHPTIAAFGDFLDRPGEPAPQAGERSAPNSREGRTTARSRLSRRRYAVGHDEST